MNFEKTTLCFLEKKMPDQAVATIMHAQQLGKFIEWFSEYVPKSET